MKRDVAKKWVGALRSGKYKQIRNALKRVKNNQIESFCALGVLCDLYQKEHPDKPLVEVKLDSKTKNGNVVEIGGSEVELPARVEKWAGIKKSSFLPSAGLSIPELNDRGTSFKKIADLIEKDQKNL